MNDHTLAQLIQRAEEAARLERAEIEEDLRALGERTSLLLQAVKRLAAGQAAPVAKLDKALRMALQELENSPRGVAVEGNGGGRVITANVDLEHVERVVLERLKSAEHAGEDREPELVDA